MGARYAILVLAIVLAAAGSGIAAKGLVGGDAIADSSLTSADVRDGSLKRADAKPVLRGAAGPRGLKGPQGPQGPQGPPGRPTLIPTVHGVVNGDGKVTGATFTVVRPTPGVYCLQIANARFAQVSSAASMAQTVAVRTYTSGKVPDGPCLPPTTVRADVSSADGTAADGAFNVLARTG